MLKVPAWLFIILTLLSIICLTLLLACLTLIIWYTVLKSKKRKWDNGKSSPFKGAFISFMGRSQELEGHSHIPQTFPVIIQRQSGSFHSQPSHSAKGTSSIGSPPAHLQSSLGKRGIECSSNMEKKHYRSQQFLKAPRKSKHLKRASSFDDGYNRRFYQKPHALDKVRTSSTLGIMPYRRGSADHLSVRSSPCSFTSDVTDQNKHEFADVEIPDPRRLVYLHSALLGESPSTESFEQDYVISYDQESGSQSSVQLTGVLFFSLFYDPMATKLIITIKRAIDLPTYDEQGLANPYVNFCIVPEDFYWQQTAIAEKTADPVFNETFDIPDVLHHKLRQYSICFLVMDSCKPDGDRVIGKVMVSLSDLRANVEVQMCRELVKG